MTTQTGPHLRHARSGGLCHAMNRTVALPTTDVATIMDLMTEVQVCRGGYRAIHTVAIPLRISLMTGCTSPHHAFTCFHSTKIVVIRFVASITCGSGSREAIGSSTA
jgi:hypothetical protein